MGKIEGQPLAPGNIITLQGGRRARLLARRVAINRLDALRRQSCPHRIDCGMAITKLKFLKKSNAAPSWACADDCRPGDDVNHAMDW